MEGSERPAEAEGPDATTEQRLGDQVCRVCGAPSGLFEECERCFLDRLESHFDQMLIGPRPRPQRRAHRPPLEPPGERRRPALRPKAPRWLPGIEGPAEPKPPPPPAAEAEPEAAAEPEAVAEPEAPAEAEAPPPEPEPEALAEPEEQPEPETPPEPKPPPEPEPELPEEEAPTRAPRRRRSLLIAGGLIAAAIGIVLLVSGGDDEEASPSAPPAAPAPPAEEPAPSPPPLLGTWSGRVEVRYEDGTRDQLNQTLRITRLEPGVVAGFSRSRQNETTCRGPVTSRGPRGDAFRFTYRELNTDECIATGEIVVTPRGDSRLDYKEITESSVNRGALTRE